MLDLRPIGYLIGCLIAGLGGLMLVPMLVDWLHGDANWQGFGLSAMISITLGVLMALAFASGPRRHLDLRQSFVLTAATWSVLAGVAALPLILGAPKASVTDAVFEAMSGLTTTGTTVFQNLDGLPLGTNLWRALLNWMGGLGIIIVAILFLPVMKIGGMQFFRAEGFDTLGKVLPRAFDISRALLQIYVTLTALCALAYLSFGMPPFEAVIHALSSVSTGGFSSRDASFTGYGPAIQITAILTMILATLPFIRFIQLAQGEPRPLWRDLQVRAYLRWICYAIMLVWLWQAMNADSGLGEDYLQSAFNIVSIFSGTGYGSGDLLGWSHLPFVVLMVVGFIGGCTSSTGCSVKVFRYLVMFEAIRTQLRRLLVPRSIQPLRLSGRRLEPEAVTSVISFVTVFVLSFGVVVILLALTGLSPLAAVTGAWTSIADIGPVFGAEVSPSGAVSDFPDAAKWIMAAAMLLGRLEILGVLVLFTRRFWQR